MDLPRGTQEQIDKGIEIIKRGGVIAFPTDTVYGLGSGAFIDSAVERLTKTGRLKWLCLLLADCSVHEVADFVLLTPGN
jgi:L-threonylcarbamoyladenylate synthase